MRHDTRKLVFLSLLVAMGTALHVVEGMIAIPLPVPGVKLGLANLATLLALRFYCLRDALTVALLRVMLASLIGGFFLSPGFLLAVTGAFGSTLIMALLLEHTRCFSMIGISVAGATVHNLGQLLAASLLLQSGAIVYYLPVLLLAALPTGICTGHLLNSLLQSNSGALLAFAPRREHDNLLL
ncbi:Gx transporter family protein [Geomonas propionica]|uniref:Gx transporter family protein n=1 Tax=Geomonas propionica TaxID=2798582 RepID=A0ABS0YQL6_9BACT|nr:Gx transporter family protein [Geomonas propionica]MBJ6799790.1 Gx transporter family protein [Geomonas propionica]